MDRNKSNLFKILDDDYLPHIVKDFATWSTCRTSNELDASRADHRIKDFAKGLTYQIGRNYIKIITGDEPVFSHRNVHSFIVLVPTKGFEIGDILKASSWSAPATNFKRGNLFDKSFDRVRWTGAD